MNKRLISANTSEVLAMNREELVQSIRASEGRVIVAETVAGRPPIVPDISNAEIARSFGADMILLNGLDIFDPEIQGVDSELGSFVEQLHLLVGCPIGANLEPVDESAETIESKVAISKGRTASTETFKEAEKVGLDFVCLTGNPGTGVTNREIGKSIKVARENFSGVIIAGKMHGAGISEAIIDQETVKTFITAGANIILVPAVGTVPGFTEADLTEIVKIVHANNGLVLSAIGTSQESSDPAVIREIALKNKICGVDIQHIGDSGFAGVAPVENIFAMSNTIRGMQHTISRVARSVNR